MILSKRFDVIVIMVLIVLSSTSIFAMKIFRRIPFEVKEKLEWLKSGIRQSDTKAFDVFLEQAKQIKNQLDKDAAGCYQTRISEAWHMWFFHALSELKNIALNVQYMDEVMAVCKSAQKLKNFFATFSGKASDLKLEVDNFVNESNGLLELFKIFSTLNEEGRRLKKGKKGSLIFLQIFLIEAQRLNEEIFLLKAIANKIMKRIEEIYKAIEVLKKKKLIEIKRKLEATEKAYRLQNELIMSKKDIKMLFEEALYIEAQITSDKEVENILAVIKNVHEKVKEQFQYALQRQKDALRIAQYINEKLKQMVFQEKTGEDNKVDRDRAKVLFDYACGVLEKITLEELFQEKKELLILLRKSMQELGICPVT